MGHQKSIQDLEIMIIGLVEKEFREAISKNRTEGHRHDDETLRDEFRMLLSLALRHAVEATVIAKHIGVTVSTVHRWAKGTFVPAQPYVREAALSGIRDLLQLELDRIKSVN